MSKYKKNKAVALKYNAAEDASPVVIASGYGTVAEHIIDIAEKKGIPVFKDDSAASLLCMLDVGSNIPVERYEVVAAIYGKLIETSAQIRGVEDAEGVRKGNAAGDGSAADKTGDGNTAGRTGVGSMGNGSSSRLRRNLASRRNRDGGEIRE